MVTRDSPALEWGINRLTERLRSHACHLPILLDAPAWEDRPSNNPHWQRHRTTYGRLLHQIEKLSLEVPF